MKLEPPKKGIALIPRKEINKDEPECDVLESEIN